MKESPGPSERRPSRWSVPWNPRGRGRNVSPVSAGSGHAAGSTATKMFSLPLLEKMEGGGREFPARPSSPRCIPWVRGCGMPGVLRPAALLTPSNCAGADTVDWMDSGKDACIDAWFSLMGFCSLSSCLMNLFDWVALSHWNMTMGVLFSLCTFSCFLDH